MVVVNHESRSAIDRSGDRKLGTERALVSRLLYHRVSASLAEIFVPIYSPSNRCILGGQHSIEDSRTTRASRRQKPWSLCGLISRIAATNR